VNFFQAQDNARRKTWQLLLLFAGAVISLIVLTNVLVAAVVFYSNTMAYGGPVSFVDRLAAMPPATWALISIGVVSMVGIACLYKYLALRGGGRAVAEMLGGQPLTYDNARGNSRRLLNVVEEMAIASGIPVPPVYLIPESSINAFAAGYSQDDAVIGINQGTIDQLNRDELQGVIAHEYSHIVNGDTRINLRLIAALHGIVFLSMVGHTILRGFRYSGSRRSSKGSGNAPILALGLGLMVIGYAGTFFGNLIKAAVSRQREYLADAAAVQFTRNPDGIANALKRIGGLSDGSKMAVASASEASHMFFGQVQRFFLNGIMATHPPLPARIKAIDPGWDGEFLTPRKSPAVTDGAPTSPTPTSSARMQAAGLAALAAAGTAEPVDDLIEEVGSLNESSLEAAQQIIETTEQRLRDAAHDAWGARGLIYAMLLDREPERCRQQQAHLATHAEAGVPEFTDTLKDAVAELDPTRRLALIDMSMPALKALSQNQYQAFISNCIALIKSDRQIDLFEWVLHRILLKELRPHFEGPRRVPVRHRSIDAIADHAATLLSELARTGHPDSATEAQKAFRTGAERLDRPIEFISQRDPNYQNLNVALAELRKLKPLLKPKVLKACAATVMADATVTDDERALLHGVAAALDCPLPPGIHQPHAPG
jgi:Zn-dependent protease with chaperone function